MAKRSKATTKAEKKPRKEKRDSNSASNQPGLPLGKRAKALKALRKIKVRPSRATKELGPTMDLSFDAPLKRVKPKPKKTPAKTKRKVR